MAQQRARLLAPIIPMGKQGLPPAVLRDGGVDIIFVPNEGRGPCFAYNTGTTWVRLIDNTELQEPEDG